MRRGAGGGCVGEEGRKDESLCPPLRPVQGRKLEKHHLLLLHLVATIPHPPP